MHALTPGVGARLAALVRFRYAPFLHAFAESPMQLPLSSGPARSPLYAMAALLFAGSSFRADTLAQRKPLQAAPHKALRDVGASLNNL